MTLSRRDFIAASAAGGLALSAAPKHIPVGLELYSVREDLKNDLPGTVKAVAKMGYQCVEFFSPYYKWTPQQAKDVRALLDDLGIKCYSTHNDNTNFTPENLPHAIELNSIIGSRNIVMASSGKVENMDDWKLVAEKLNYGLEKAKSAGIKTGYHNHQLEFKAVDGVRPIEILATNTHKDVMLQLDVGTCVEVGSDPVAWIEKNPGRIRALHCKDWSAENGYKVLFGEGSVPWTKVFDAAEKTGGVEFYLVEQEGSRYPAEETAERCLAAFRKIRPA